MREKANVTGVQASGSAGLGGCSGDGGKGENDGGISIRHANGSIGGGDGGGGALGEGGGVVGGGSGGGSQTVRSLTRMATTVAPRTVTSMSRRPQANWPLVRVKLVEKVMFPALHMGMGCSRW